MARTNAQLAEEIRSKGQQDYLIFDFFAIHQAYGLPYSPLRFRTPLLEYLDSHPDDPVRWSPTIIIPNGNAKEGNKNWKQLCTWQSESAEVPTDPHDLMRSYRKEQKMTNKELLEWVSNPDRSRDEVIDAATGIGVSENGTPKQVIDRIRRRLKAQGLEVEAKWTPHIRGTFWPQAKEHMNTGLAAKHTGTSSDSWQQNPDNLRVFTYLHATGSILVPERATVTYRGKRYRSTDRHLVKKFFGRLILEFDPD